ncbi:hypothetical protein OIDMADRAFT_145985 [Oidiodendron maius Zn]|uniref:Uncharacterized protein n=1 Tax=Oidiodendron maius (strain Zn) TaxID=913774 RepID=A0A0C3DF05_OIDMZ|nr:hypothetical protein OIDMADRAFT_145985 [Oidiodendron maius Zn]
METFVVVIDLKILDPENNTASESNNSLRYKTWCTIIELDAGSLDPTALFDKINDYLRHSDLPYRENQEFIATAAIQREVIVQVTLGLEKFLDRKEFTLAVDLHTSKDKQKWENLRNLRIKLENLGYITNYGGGKDLNEGQDL